MKRLITVSVMFFFWLSLSLTLWPQQPHKTSAAHKPAPTYMTNADVIKMTKAGLPESTIITTIQTRKSKFDVSPDGLIALHRAGVTQAEMDAMMAATGGAVPPSPMPPQPSSPSAPDPAPAQVASGHSRLPQVSVMQNGSAMELPLEKTQLAQTKTKPSSMKSLAADSVVTQALTAEVGTATNIAASRVSSTFGSSTMQQGASIFSGMMARRKPSMTFVWGVNNPTSTNILQTSSPNFTVNYSNVTGVNIDEFEPMIVKLTPAQNSVRIVGATEGKEDVTSNPAADWQIYSSFLEERVAAKSQKIAKGQYQIIPATSLMPGEYAIVLRPVSKSKKFSGGEVARGQGDGMMFDSVWSFAVPPDAN
ncbi:MAG TPA: hypothetical protein VLM42_04865 [Bryobacteraceae bacterium]|nr:hypothetical protein [Bryobacteraceae bacterium]